MNPLIGSQLSRIPEEAPVVICVHCVPRVLCVGIGKVLWLFCSQSVSSWMCLKEFRDQLATFSLSLPSLLIPNILPKSNVSRNDDIYQFVHLNIF